jgi:hypothetical protein
MTPFAVAVAIAHGMAAGGDARAYRRFVKREEKISW